MPTRRASGETCGRECGIALRDAGPASGVRCASDEDGWDPGVHDEIAEMFGALSVPTYECVGLLGALRVIRKAIGSLATGERRRGRDLEKKRATNRAHRERNREADLARKKTPEARARNREYLRRLKEAA